MSQIKGTFFKIYFDSERIGYAKSSSLSKETAEIDITTTESLGDKESIPGKRSITASVEGLIDFLLKNRILFSEDLNNAAWIKNSSTVTSNDTAAPDGSMTGDRLNIPDVGDFVGQEILFSITDGNTFTASVWLKAAAPGVINLTLRSADESQGTTLQCNVTTEWKRFTVSFAFSGTETGLEMIIVRNLVSDLTQVYAWGAQVEDGEVMTTYQPTPRVNPKDIFQGIEAGSTYEAEMTNGITGDKKQTGTAWVKSLNHEFPDNEAAAFSAEIEFTGTVSNTTI